MRVPISINDDELERILDKFDALHPRSTGKTVSKKLVIILTEY